MSNPFVIDSIHGQLRPLQPWRVDRDSLFYVAVDNTEEQFSLFTARLSQPQSLIDAGRLALVTGHAGCGKTSLVNRCALWAHEQLKASGIQSVIIDLTQEVTLSEPADTRIRKVFNRLVDELGQAGLINDMALNSLLSMGDQPGRGYARLRTLLLGNPVVIVLLPPSGPLVDEVEQYASFARQRILFFAESSYAQDMVTMCQTSSRTASVIYLNIGLINNGDGWAFVRNRLQYSNSSSVPAITEATVRRMVRNWNNMSVKTLEQILHGVFERAIAGSRKRITYNDIGDYVIQLMGEQENPGW